MAIKYNLSKFISKGAKVTEFNFLRVGDFNYPAFSRLSVPSLYWIIARHF